MSKGELIKVLEKEGLLTGSTDTAIPLGWANKVRELGIDTTWYVWNYGVDKFGAPVNLAELYMKVKDNFMIDIIHNTKELNYGG